MPDTMKVVLDYNYAKKDQKDSIDTGLYQMIYKGAEINMSQKRDRSSVGGPKLNLVLEGTRWKGAKSKNKRKKRK